MLGGFPVKGWLASVAGRGAALVIVNVVPRSGATVVIHGSGLEESKLEAQRIALESSGEVIFCHLHDDVRVIAGNATVRSSA